MLETIDLKQLKKEDITNTAKSFSERLCNTEGFKSTQLRKYYNNLMALKSKYSGITSESRAIELDLGIFASKVEYGMIKNIKERNAFKFYKDNVIGLSDKVKTGEQFKNFMIVMEAIVAYFPKQKD